MTPRLAAFETLLRCEKEKQYSNIAINQTIKKYAFEKRDRDFYTQLVYGVVERKLTLDYLISQYTQKSIQRLDLSVVIILRLSLYQIHFLTKIPDNAAVSEGVKLASRFAARTKGYVNAILRKACQNDIFSLTCPNDTSPRALSIQYSINRELIRLLSEQYPTRYIDFLKDFFTIPQTAFQVNSLNTSPEEFIANHNLTAHSVKDLPFSVKMQESCSLSDTTFLDTNEAFVQDIASQLTAIYLDPLPSDRIIDVCACPGGKSFAAANFMCSRGPVTGQIISCDLHESKLPLIEKGAQRLGYSFITTVCHDATKPIEKYREYADKVICDVPCSGLGVISKKPEIRYKEMNEIDKLPEVQRKILETASTYVKTGGTLLYSTCTINKKENEEVILDFLKHHPEFALSTISPPEDPSWSFDMDVGITLFPSSMHDGFYMVKLIKK